jgi:hypothetical protein
LSRFRRPPLDIYEVLSDPDHPAFIDLGRLFWSLIADQPAWVFRRVETASLIAEQRIRRVMSVDCRVLPDVVDLAEDLGFDRFIIPLRFVMSGSLLSFDLRHNDDPVPLLTRDQNTLATQALLYAAVDQCDIDLSTPLRANLAQVSRADMVAAPPTLDLLGLGSQRRPDETVEEALLRWAVTTFDQKYLLLADIPLADAQHRSVFKIIQELPQHPLPSPAHRIRQQVAWEPMSFVFDAPDVTAAGSYHFQFTAPDGLTVSDGTLLAANEERTHVEAFGTTTRRSSVLGLNSHIGGVPDTDSYAAVVKVRPSPDGLLRASAASAVFTTVLLLIASTWANRLQDEQLGSSITLLLVLPGVVSTFLARPGEHSMVSRVLRGVRFLMLTSAVIIYLGAGALAMGMSGQSLRVVWLVLATVSAVPTIVLAVAVHRCRLTPWSVN